MGSFATYSNSRTLGGTETSAPAAINVLPGALAELEILDEDGMPIKDTRRLAERGTCMPLTQGGGTHSAIQSSYFRSGTRLRRGAVHPIARDGAVPVLSVQMGSRPSSPRSAQLPLHDGFMSRHEG